MEIIAPVTVAGLDNVGKKKLIKDIFTDNGYLIASDSEANIVLILRPLTQNH